MKNSSGFFFFFLHTTHANIFLFFLSSLQVFLKLLLLLVIKFDELFSSFAPLLFCPLLQRLTKPNYPLFTPSPKFRVTIQYCSLLFRVVASEIFDYFKLLTIAVKLNKFITTSVVSNQSNKCVFAYRHTTAIAEEFELIIRDE